MKWIILILSCCSALAQHPLMSGSGIDWTRSTSSRWYPTNAANTLFYWFEVTPTNSARLNADGSGGVPGNAVRAGSWINIASGQISGSDGATFPTNFTSGGGVNGTSPRISFNTQISDRFVTPGLGVTLTNFTLMCVMNASNAAAGSQEFLGNANNPPYIDVNANKFTINCGNAVSGAATIANGTWYIVTWVQKGATSEIKTNDVTYVTGDSGTVGYTSIQGMYIAHDRVTQFSGNISRIWVWTNTLSAGDNTSAINQCKTDFGFP